MKRKIQREKACEEQMKECRGRDGRGGEKNQDDKEVQE